MKHKNESENDIAWARFFAHTDVLGRIVTNGSCLVRATDLKAIGGREPRLMAKLDTLSSLPGVFLDNRLTLFPTRNGEYIIFPDPDQKTYFKLKESDYPSSIERYRPNVDLHAFDSFPGLQKLNESQALDFAFVSSLLRHVTNDQGLNLVIRGRTYSGSFGFVLPESSEEVRVDGVQIEVDGGYESHDLIVLIEAKVGRRGDFNMRQLYYPFLEWSSRSRKRIVPLFLVVTNGLFYFFEVRFGQQFGDIAVAQARCFTIDESPVTQVNLAAAFGRVAVEFEPKDIPFPQANDLDKVVDVVSILNTSAADKRRIAEHFEFDERQGDYYGNAAAYLGFARRHSEGFEITEFGRSFISEARRANRTSVIIDQMLRRPVFREVIHLLVGRSMQINSITHRDVCSAIERRTQLKGSTPTRRASTVLNWLRWIGANATLVE